MARPIIALPACHIENNNGIAAHSVHEAYVEAISTVAEAIPIIVPGGPTANQIDELLAVVDGVCFTGSRSNVAPHHYNGVPSRAGTLHDPARDALTLPLVQRAVAQQVPLFAICRGLQEVNVACGGTLHQHIHEIEGNLVHHKNHCTSNALRFAKTHPVNFTQNSFIAELVGAQQLEVNSVHSQAIDRLGKGLIAEAYAPDGVVEAFYIDNGAEFAIAVQWHPEWLIKLMDDAPSRALFSAFGRACRRYRDTKNVSNTTY